MLIKLKKMERISKPHIVDLLRIFDRRKWFMPRIRYASVRSKPELIKDLKRFFFTYEREGMLNFKTRAGVGSAIPPIAYRFATREYLFDGVPYDVPTESRRKVAFSISHEPVTLRFDDFR